MADKHKELAEEIFKVIEDLGEAVCETLVQMLKNGWVDDEGKVIASLPISRQLADALNQASFLRERLAEKGTSDEQQAG